MSNQLLEEEQKQFVDVADITEVPGGKMKHLDSPSTVISGL
jgi:hypothetical protein